jgi:16S rRNA (guanine527-N7)-methyltransferase
LETGLQTLGFEHAHALSKALLQFADILLEANRRTNLVGAKTVDGLIANHFLDSLAPLAGLNPAEPILDVGSGAGLPGIPVALAWPRRRVVLIEPRARRARFLEDTVVALHLRNVEVVRGSAQNAAGGVFAGRAGTALVRALAKPVRALELALPLLRSGGTAILYLGRTERPNSAEASAMRKLGGRLVEARRVSVPYLDAQRHVWFIEKTDQRKKRHEVRRLHRP